MSGRASSSVLVGRDDQTAALEAAFGRVRQGGPSAVLLGGEAGVGKSRLVSDFGRTAAAAGARVLTGGCLELGTDGLPFAPFTAVLRELMHEMGADALASMLPGRTTRGLARLLPELGEPDTSGDPAEARARLFEALLCRDGELSPELPESLRDLLLDSVRRLPEDTQEVLRVASAGGEITGHALLSAVSGLDDAALTRAVRPAVTANVLHPRGDGYAFRHELIREAVHDDLLPGEHGRLHSRFAEAIDARPALVPPGRAAIEMAHHWHAAHDAAWALTGAWRAAAQAGRAVAAPGRGAPGRGAAW